MGSLDKLKVVGILDTVDLLKRDTELKILFDCADEEIQLIENFADCEEMQAINIKLRKGD